MVTFRRPPRIPPPKPPKGKNVIPFDVKRTRPPGGTRLGDIVPDPPINLEQIRKAKERELRDAIQLKDLPKENISSPEDQLEQGVSTKEREERRSLREQQGLSGLGEEVPVKTDIEKYVDVLTQQKRSEGMKHLHNFMRDVVIFYNDPDLNPLKNRSLEALVNNANDIRDLLLTDHGVPMSVKRIEELRAVYDKIFKEIKARRLKKKTRGKEGELEEALIKLSETTEAAKRKTLLRDIITKYSGVSPSKLQDAYDGIYKSKAEEKGLSGLGEDIKKRGEKAEGEWLDSVFGSITDVIKPKDMSKQKWITEIEDYGLSVEEIKEIVIRNIAKKWDKDTEPRALSKKEWIEELKDWEGMKDDPHEFLGPWFREWLESLQKE